MALDVKGQKGKGVLWKRKILKLKLMNMLKMCANSVDCYDEINSFQSFLQICACHVEKYVQQIIENP